MDDEASGAGGGSVDEAERCVAFSEGSSAEKGEGSGDGLRDYLVGIGGEGDIGSDVSDPRDTCDFG